MQKFNYHQHTYRCGHADLNYTDEEYVLEYIKMGFKKIAFTDHCPQKSGIDKRTNMRMKYDERNEYLESIKKLREKYSDKIEIETGYEVEYLPGEEENLIELKNETDKLVLGQHFVYDDKGKLKIIGQPDSLNDDELLTYAEYIEKAMKLGIPDIIAHPDLYMLKKKEFGKREEEVAHLICKAAEKYNIPLEINLNKIFRKTYYENDKLNNLPIEEQKKRLSRVEYPCKGFWNIAKEYNIKVVYGLDVHHKGHILLWNELLELAHEILGDEILDKLKFISF